MSSLDRRRFLEGALAGVAAGSAAGFFGGRAYGSSSHRAGPQGGAAPGIASAPPGAASAAARRPGVDGFPRVSFAQQGEDLIIRDMLGWFRITRPTYLDIGANDPVVNSNTYLFYLRGSRGVLVEPNPALVARLQKERPEDRVLPIGIGPKDDPGADFYMIRGADELNTFSKEQADYLVKVHGPGTIERVVKVPLVNVNAVIAENFDVAPNILSVDTEGLDLEILRSLDFTRFRPHVICAETLAGETGLPEEPIIDLLRGKDYSVRGGTFVNTVFLANELLAHRNEKPK